MKKSIRKNVKIIIFIIIYILTINTNAIASTTTNKNSGPKIIIKIDDEVLIFLGLVFVGTFIFVYVMSNLPKWKYQHSKKVASYNDYVARNSVPQKVEPVMDIRQSSIYADEIKEIDPNFIESDFLSWTKSLFVKMQNAWTNREWEEMRVYETRQLFHQHKQQIQSYIDLKQINVLERPVIKYATIYKFKQKDGKDIVDVALKVVMKNYVINEETKELVDGNPYEDFIRVYKLTFERKTGVLTKPGELKIDTINCPNCGASTEIISSGKCEYCGSIITSGKYAWVLSGIQPLVS